MKRIFFIIMAILSFNLVSAGLQLEWTNDYCNTDFNCFDNAICISAYTTNDIFVLSSKSDANVFEAERYGKEGMCAKIFYDVGNNEKVYYSNYVGTQNIPDVVVEAVECPACSVCENITTIKYVNQTVYEDKIIRAFKWSYAGAFLFIALVLLITEFFYVRKRMNNKLNKKYGKRIGQLDALDKQYPGFSDRNIKVKTLSEEELNKIINKSWSLGMGTKKRHRIF